MKHPVQVIFEKAGYKCSTYSGRGMYGKYCLGVTYSHLGEAISKVITAVGGNLYWAEQVAEAFLDLRLDSMGRGSIMYFPGVEYYGDPEGDDSEDDY